MTSQGYTPLGFFIELVEVIRVRQVDGFTIGFRIGLQEGFSTFDSGLSKTTYNTLFLVVLGYMDEFIGDIQGFADKGSLD